MSFDEFWKACPKKVGKIACRKSYARQLRIIKNERPADDPHEVLLKAMLAYSKSELVREGYVTNPLTWLNQGRYYDELEPAAKPPCHRSTSRMDDTTRQEMARAAAIRNQRVQRKPMPTNLTRAFDRGYRPPDGWFFPIADPYRMKT